MTFAALRDTVGREPVTVIEIDLDKCMNTYGVHPCTAGTNLLSNGNLDTDTTGWLNNNATLSVVDSSVDPGAASGNSSDNCLKVVDAGAASRAYQAFTTIAGKTYTVGFLAYSPSSNVAADEEFIVKDSTSTGTALVSATIPSEDVWHVITMTFVAISTTTVVTFQPASNTADVLYIDGVTAKQSGSECFNTRKTCHDTPNYINSSSVSPQTPLILKFSDREIDGENYLPCVISTKLSPVEISPGQPFGKRASIEIVLKDFPYHDRGIDPYVSTRSYNPVEQGTYFNKLIARNPFYQGRALRLNTGYVDDPFSTGDLQTQNYIIEKIVGPDKQGYITITAKDILKHADDERSQCPVASTGKLVAAISAAATSLTVTSGTESEYAGDYIKIGDEVIYAPVASRGSPANVFPITTRGAWNTVAASHGLDDAVQECKHFDAVNVRDILEDLYVNYASIPSAYINSTDWDAEEALWLSGVNLTALITDPTGVKTLIDELSEQTMVYLWWEPVSQEIKLKAIAPIADRTIELNDDDSFIKDPVVTIKQEDRISRVLVYYSPRNPIEFDSPEHFDSLYGFISTNEESADEYNDIRIKTIFARWITSDALAVQTGSRTRNQFRDPPKFITFTVDAKDSESVTGDYIDINTRAIQDADGSNKATAVQILKSEEITKNASGTQFRMKCQETQFSGRYGRIMANTSPDGDYNTATDAEKASGCFIVAAGQEIFTQDIGEAYKIA